MSSSSGRMRTYTLVEGVAPCCIELHQCYTLLQGDALRSFHVGGDPVYPTGASYGVYGAVDACLKRRLQRSVLYHLLVVHCPYALLALGRALAAVLGAWRWRPARLQLGARHGRPRQCALAAEPPPARAAEAGGSSLRVVSFRPVSSRDEGFWHAAPNPPLNPRSALPQVVSAVLLWVVFCVRLLRDCVSCSRGQERAARATKGGSPLGSDRLEAHPQAERCV
jgi:hypothetical protein